MQRLTAQGAATCCVRGTLRISGKLHRERLLESIRTVVARHEVLQTCLVRDPEGHLQIDRAETPLCVWERGAEARDRTIDPERGPVVVAELTLVGPQCHQLTLDVAILGADPISLELLFREIANEYAGILPERPRYQYADLATWLNEMATDTGMGSQYWRGVLRGFEDVLRLPGERKPDTTAPRWLQVTRRVDIETWRKVSDIALRKAVTPAAVLFACWQALLWRLTRVKRLLVAVALSGRSYEEMGLVVGPLERQVPIVRDCDEVLSLETLLLDAHDQLTTAAGWQEHFSWEDSQTLGHGQARCGFAHYQLPPTWSCDGLDWEMLASDVAMQDNTVVLVCTSSDRGLTCRLGIDESRLDGLSAESLLRQYEVVLRQFAELPLATAMTNVEIVGDVEHAMLHSFNRTAADFRCDRTVMELFDTQVARTPDNVALMVEGEGVSYRDLDILASRLANLLAARGAGPEQVVGVCMDRDSSLIATMLAIWKAGAAYLPLRDCPESRLEYMLADSGTRLIVTESRYAGSFESAGVTVVVLDPGWQESLHHEPIQSRASDPANVAYVIYTSGSTGDPKGVMVEHRSLLNHMLWAVREFGLGERERVLMKTSISFDASVWEWLFPLIQGGTLVLLEEGMQRDPRHLVREMRARGVTTLQVVPTLLRVLVEEPLLVDCSELVRVFVGGEALDATLVRRFHERTGKPLINLYGPTEATIDTTSLVMEPQHGSAIGRPIANTQIRLLRPDGSRAAIGEAGEICIAGAALARGYVNRAAETAARYSPDPFGTAGERLYWTGDRARYRADGVLEFLGRDDDQVKIRGYRIEVAEVESVIQAQSGVRQAAVLVKERKTGERQLVAYVQLTGEDSDLALERIRAGARRNLPEYMCPAKYVRIDVLPRTRSGKLDRVALRELPEDASTPGVGPRNPVEAALTDIWKSALGVANVGVTDNFFEIGGDSIIGILIVARARRLGIALTPLQLFQYQTVAELAEVVRSSHTTLQVNIEPEDGEFPLTPIQYAFLQQPNDNLNHFNQALLFDIRPEVRLDVLEDALARMVEHHASLRLRFRQTAAGWRQRYSSPSESRCTIAHEDLSDGADVDEALGRALQREHARTDIAAGPIIRLAVMELGPARGKRLLIVVHHLAIDAVSWRILLEDVADCYRQLISGKELHLPARTSSYRSWAEGLARHAGSGRLEGELDYWLAQQRRPVESLPIDEPAGANTVRYECHETGMLDSSATQDLLREAGKAYKTQIIDLLLSALCAALHRWRGLKFVRVTLEGHGRAEMLPGIDLTRTVGWFTSLYPFVLEYRPEEGLAERIKRVKDELREVPNKGVGYGMLRHLCPESGLEKSGGGLMVNYLGQLDNTLGRDVLLPLAPERCGDSASPGCDRGANLELNAMVIEGCLRMDWSYSAQCYQQHTVASLARAFELSLHELIVHCKSPGRVEITPGDVTDFSWDASQLEKIRRAIARAGEA